MAEDTIMGTEATEEAPEIGVKVHVDRMELDDVALLDRAGAGQLEPGETSALIEALKRFVELEDGRSVGKLPVSEIRQLVTAVGAEIRSVADPRDSSGKN